MNPKAVARETLCMVPQVAARKQYHKTLNSCQETEWYSKLLPEKKYMASQPAGRKQIDKGNPKRQLPENKWKQLLKNRYMESRTAGGNRSGTIVRCQETLESSLTDINQPCLDSCSETNIRNHGQLSENGHQNVRKWTSERQEMDIRTSRSRRQEPSTTVQCSKQISEYLVQQLGKGYQEP